MARTYTRAELRTRARQRADMEDSPFITDAEINGLLSHRLTDLYDTLMESGLLWLQKEVTVVGDGNELYDLPSDFYGVVAVDYNYSANHFIPLHEYMARERTVYENLRTGSRFPLAYAVIGRSNSTDQISLLPGTPQGQNVRVRYIPAPIKLEDPDSNDGTVVNGVSGYEELIIVGTAIDMLSKEESSTVMLERRYEALMAKVQSAAEIRAWASPRRIVDTDNIDDMYWWQYVRNTSTGGP